MNVPTSPRKPATTELRKFGLAVGGAFLILAAIAYWRGRVATPTIFGLLGGCLVLAGLTAPSALASVYAAWMKFALALSKITTPIFMGVVYFVVISPLGLIMRLFGRRPFRSLNADSEWVSRPVGKRAGSLERQF